MLKRLVVFLMLVAAVAFPVFWWLTSPETIAAEELAAHTADVEKGRTLFNAGGCASCHMTPGQDDRLRLGGGLAMHSEFGTFHVPNISPDPKDGIGGWTNAQFASALLKGTGPDGRHYYPSFPYTSYQLMTPAQTQDLFAYIKTLPPVSGAAPAHELAFPFNMRRTLGVWKLMFVDGKTFTPDLSKSPEWNRGAYLVNGPGHCAECHSPRNALGGIITAQRFAGGADPEGKGWVPNITQKRLGDWSERDISYFLETGSTPEGDTTGGSMASVIRNLSQLSLEDRNAMAVYLKSLAPVDGPVRPQAKSN